ncbi:response regulator receiver domain [Pedobacter ghigonis]|uniref:response regulator receiver domain n=1 Tax=Pedobacter ghigonis TaxID=2730403 RepID=UPI001588D8A2|nr:response regulator receiver domain [Pedobacter ghigonis]
MASLLYNQTAKKIIKDSIKSVVFIDEKALEAYVPIPNKPTLEEDLSLKLFRKFKKSGASLTVHKFFKDDLSKPELMKYLFDNRDLVLLDWELDEDYATGKSYSLRLLADVVASAHLHFCAIYTATTKESDVFDNIVSFFFGKNTTDFEQIRVDTDPYLSEISKVLDAVDIYNPQNNARLIPQLKEIEGFIGTAIKSTGIKELTRALIAIKIANNTSFITSTNRNHEPEFIDRPNKIVVINNTIVTLIKKDHRRDPNRLLNRLSTQISKSNNSFTQLLGIEMQNIFARKGSFVDSNLLNISLKTFLYHRRQMIGKSSDLPFELFIKDLLIAQAKLNLRDERLTILETSFLDKVTPKRLSATINDIAKINTFYNGSSLREERKVNFGDIFKVGTEEYYMCITPLCDCLYPEDNIKNKYFFVKGISFKNLEEAISLGDEAFISYLDENTCISWAGAPPKSSKTDKHKPIYVKPNQLYVAKSIIIGGKLNANDFVKGKSVNIDMTYCFTLRQQYAQRIANHAFSHPLRIGIDFVKK